MSNYTLSAQLGTMFEVTPIEAEDDILATAQAVATIIRKAMHNGHPNALQRLWARGEITLRNPQGVEMHQLAELGYA